MQVRVTGAHATGGRSEGNPYRLGFTALLTLFALVGCGAGAQGAHGATSESGSSVGEMPAPIVSKLLDVGPVGGYALVDTHGDHAYVLASTIGVTSVDLTTESVRSFWRGEGVNELAIVPPVGELGAFVLAGGVTSRVEGYGQIASLYAVTLEEGGAPLTPEVQGTLLTSANGDIHVFVSDDYAQSSRLLTIPMSKSYIVGPTYNQPFDQFSAGTRGGTAALSDDGRLLYVLDAVTDDPGVVHVTDMDRRMVVKDFSVGSRPRGLVLSPDQSTLYVSYTTKPDILVLDAVTGEQLTTLPVFRSGHSWTSGLAVSADGRLLYATENLSGEPILIVFDVVTQARVEVPLTGLDRADGVAVSESGSVLVAGEKGDRTGLIVVRVEG